MAFNFLNNRKPEASVSTPFKRKQQKQILLLLVILMAIAVVLFWGFFGGSKEPEFVLNPEDSTSERSLAKKDFSFVSSNYEMDNSFLSRELFDDYKVFGQHLVVVGELGVESPFINVK